ncbi:hypothetical protein [Actinomadura sp. 21ATH]|uniref:hypothetical protein n=1 Tax=Actinomadura sp. 21ATH TaxID=1735444 RepID=UPI0035BEF2E5
MRLDDRLLYDSEGSLRARAHPPLPRRAAVVGVVAIVLGLLFALGSWFWWDAPALAPLGGVLVGPGMALTFSWAVRRRR